MKGLGHAFEELDYVVLVDEAHLAVDLREFGLAVGAQVFVAEAFHCLEIAVHAAHHQQLLESLGRLRQSVELSGIHARGHHEVAGAFEWAHKHGVSISRKSFAIEVAADFHGHAVAQFEVAAHVRAAQVRE